MKKSLMMSLIIPVAVLFFRPFDLSMSQSIVLATLILTITWWATGVVPKTIASILMLLVFTFFGNTPILKILQFPLSDNFIILILSFLFSQGIINSRIAEKLVEPLLFRYTQGLYSIIFSIFVFALILIFVIPQPFARVIILSSIYYEYFTRLNLDKRMKELLLFAVFSFTVSVNMLFIRGDIILNNALLIIGEMEISGTVWAKYMTVPTTIFCLLCAVLFLAIFNKELKSRPVKEKESFSRNSTLTGLEKKYLLLIAVSVVLWSTEALHRINNIVFVSIVIMFYIGLLKKEDLKCINIELLIFLTAAFSIGSVMTQSGVAQTILSHFMCYFPKEFSLWYLLIVICTCIALHAVLGSNLTTLSVTVPALSLISSGIMQKELLLFTIFVSVCGHYFMPFHSVIIMIGNGNEYYSSKTVFKYGMALTLLMVIAVFCVFLPWWRFVATLH